MLGAIFKITKPGHVVVAGLFVGVPTTVSLSRFLSLIPLRLLTDPEHTNSPHFAKKKKKKKSHAYYFLTLVERRYHSDEQVYFQPHLAFYTLAMQHTKI